MKVIRCGVEWSADRIRENNSSQVTRASVIETAGYVNVKVSSKTSCRTHSFPYYRVLATIALEGRTTFSSACSN